MDAVTNCLQTRWKAMHQRAKAQKGNYGKFSVCVCPEWSGEDGFENFRQWALSNGFQRNLVLDRRNTYGQYSPDNCRWVSQKENNRNKTNTVFIEDGTEKIPLSEYCEKYGLGKTGYNRLYMRDRRSKRLETPL